MAFINVIVHSADNLNFRVHLQHEFTMLGLDEHVEVQYIEVYLGINHINNIVNKITMLVLKYM